MSLSKWPPPEADGQLLLVSFVGLSEDETLRKIRATFHSLMIGEVRRILEMEEPTGVAAAILACCAIDFLGTLHVGRAANGETFRSFVRDYMPTEYDPNKLVQVRNRLVHNYVLPPGFAGFTVGREWAAEHYGTAARGGPTVLVIDTLVDAIQAAGERLFLSTRGDTDARERMLARSRKPGLLAMYTLPIGFRPS